MAPPKARVPAVDGWFTLDEAGPQLLGTRCKSCGTYFFPKESFACRNPRCGASELEETPLSRRGKLWSFTDNRYAPPKPYMAGDPFEPYAVAAVELEHEKMVVLGQVAKGVGCEQLHAGQVMELVLDTLYEDASNDSISSGSGGLPSHGEGSRGSRRRHASVGQVGANLRRVWSARRARGAGRRRGSVASR